MKDERGEVKGGKRTVEHTGYVLFDMISWFLCVLDDSAENGFTR